MAGPGNTQPSMSFFLRTHSVMLHHSHNRNKAAIESPPSIPRNPRSPKPPEENKDENEDDQHTVRPGTQMLTNITAVGADRACQLLIMKLCAFVTHGINEYMPVCPPGAVAWSADAEILILRQHAVADQLNHQKLCGCFAHVLKNGMMIRQRLFGRWL